MFMKFNNTVINMSQVIAVKKLGCTLRFFFVGQTEYIQAAFENNEEASKALDLITGGKENV